MTTEPVGPRPSAAGEPETRRVAGPGGRAGRCEGRCRGVGDREDVVVYVGAGGLSPGEAEGDVGDAVGYHTEDAEPHRHHDSVHASVGVSAVPPKGEHDADGVAASLDLACELVADAGEVPLSSRVLAISARCAVGAHRWRRPAACSRGRCTSQPEPGISGHGRPPRRRNYSDTDLALGRLRPRRRVRLCRETAAISGRIDRSLTVAVPA